MLMVEFFFDSITPPTSAAKCVILSAISASRAFLFLLCTQNVHGQMHTCAWICRIPSLLELAIRALITLHSRRENDYMYRCMIVEMPKRISKTYNRRDSQMVTHSSTSRPVQCLCMAERTGCPVFTDLWSYVFLTVNKKFIITTSGDRGSLLINLREAVHASLLGLAVHPGIHLISY